MHSVYFFGVAILRKELKKIFNTNQISQWMERAGRRCSAILFSFYVVFTTDYDFKEGILLSLRE